MQTPPTLNDLDLTTLVGDAALRRGRALYSAGGVSATRASGPVLAARVRDKMQRLFQVSINLEEQVPTVTCSCGQPGVCEHAAALLVAWVSYPSSFANVVLAESAAAVQLPRFAPGALWRGLRGESGTLAALLQLQRINDLRRQAQRVGLVDDGADKERLALRLAPLLAAPDQQAAAVAALTPPQRVVLDLLLLFDSSVGPLALERAAQLLGNTLGTGGAEGVLKALSALGLAFSTTPGHMAMPSWQVPQELALALTPTPLPLAQELPTDAAAPRAELALAAYVRGLQALLEQRPAPARPQLRRSNFELDNRGLSAWNNMPDEVDALWRKSPSGLFRDAELTIMPPEPLVTNVALQQIAEALGRPVAEARLLLRLLSQLELLDEREGAVRLVSSAHLLQQLPALEQARLLANAWANQLAWSELHELPGVLLRRNLTGTLYLRPDQLYAELAAARRFVVRLVRALAPGRVYRASSLAEQVFKLRPLFLLDQRGNEEGGAWYLTDEHKKRLDLKRAAHWKLAGEPFIRQVLRELGILGIVTFDEPADAVQLTDLGSSLLGLSDAYRPAPREPALRVSDDLRVRLPLAAADGEHIALLDRVATLERLEAGELHYRIMPRTLRDGLTAGITSGALRDFLQRQSRTRLPRAALTTLDAWAAGFGRAQIYRRVALLELADELLLPELLRATSLPNALLDQLSPRLLLIDPARSDALWAELVAKGYTPQRVKITH